MAIYLLSYDLSKPGRNYDDLIAYLEKTYGADGHILDSVWLIESTSDAGEIRDAAQKLIDSNDKLVVLALKPTKGGRWATHKVPGVGDWFEGR